MPRATDPARIAGCEALGARVSLHDDMAAAFGAMNVAAAQGRALLHPFEARHMVLGAAVCALEYVTQAPDLDTFVVPVGGGGLISGMACAIRQLRPDAQVIGVEPYGADSMFQSLAQGAPVTLDKIATIADSLGAPMALPYTFGVAQAHVAGLCGSTMQRCCARWRFINPFCGSPPNRPVPRRLPRSSGHCGMIWPGGAWGSSPVGRIFRSPAMPR